MQRKQLSRIALSSLLSILIFGLMISACTINIGSIITGITVTPITPSPTPRTCPDIEFDPNSGLEVKRTFIVVLFDENSTAQQKTLEYQDGQRTDGVVEFIVKLLPEVLDSGDEYSIFRLGFRTYEGARYERYISRISEAPDIFPTPQPHQTLTSIPTPMISQGTPGLVIVQEKNRYTTQVAAQHATATQMAFEDFCEIAAYATAYESTNTAWTATNDAIATDIATSIVHAETTPFVIETPFAKEVVYEGLGHATIDLETQCSKYDRCILLIIDNMVDWRNAGPGNEIPPLHLNLSNAEAIVVLPNCRDINQPSCIRIQNLWTDELISFGAKDPVIYLNGDRLEETLISMIGGK